MAAITIRNLEDGVQRRLKERAASNNRSMESEARAILSDAVAIAGFGDAWLAMARSSGGVELDIPARSLPRDLDLA